MSDYRMKEILDEAHQQRKRAERAEAECEELRRELALKNDIIRRHSNPPEGEPESSNKDMDRLEYRRSLGLHRSNDAPHTPEQAHGDALAALDRILLRGDNAKCGDFQIVRNALTASGVPEDTETCPYGHCQLQFRVRVPEEVRRLPEQWQAESEEIENQAEDALTAGVANRYLGRAVGMRVAAKELERALASAPADGWKLVPVEPTQDMIERGTSCYGSNNNPRMIYRAMIAAAPTDGRED